MSHKYVIRRKAHARGDQQKARGRVVVVVVEVVDVFRQCVCRGDGSVNSSLVIRSGIWSLKAHINHLTTTHVRDATRTAVTCTRAYLMQVANARNLSTCFSSIWKETEVTMMSGEQWSVGERNTDTAWQPTSGSASLGYVSVSAHIRVCLGSEEQIQTVKASPAVMGVHRKLGR